MTEVILVVTLILIVIVGVTFYNSLVRLRYLVEEAWSGIDVQLKRRHNLIPSLVATVKGYSDHEQETLEKIAEHRSQSEKSSDVKEIGEIEKAIAGDIKRIFAIAEAYPDLKADESFLDLQKNLVEIEDQLQFARRYYNGTVRNYKISLESFPSNIIANIGGFQDAEFFEVDYASERENPDIEL
jgi:LemA protein